MNATDKLVIFDYSGTLSLEGPRFAGPDRLEKALRQSGLFALGVTTPDFFWEQIVDPTWIEGSTTAIGYKKVMTARMEALVPSPDALQEKIATAVSHFVDGYFDRSRIDPAWRPILERLSAHPEMVPVIATDHYAEATETIIRNLHSWNIGARKAGEEIGPCRPAEEGAGASSGQGSPILIANSADIGFWKADPRFWEFLKKRLPPGKIQSILIVDDFGFNEEQGDRYGESVRVEARQRETLAVLEKTFEATVEATPFFLTGEERSGNGKGAAKIVETVRRIEQFLNPGGER
ncbi:MAG: hypothetical protein PHI99_07605 [Syntrophales bacterium]|nr:hypothetical protein [Syntrophales bacterium]